MVVSGSVFLTNSTWRTFSLSWAVGHVTRHLHHEKTSPHVELLSSWTSSLFPSTEWCTHREWPKFSLNCDFIPIGCGSVFIVVVVFFSVDGRVESLTNGWIDWRKSTAQLSQSSVHFLIFLTGYLTVDIRDDQVLWPKNAGWNLQSRKIKSYFLKLDVSIRRCQVIANYFYSFFFST